MRITKCDLCKKTIKNWNKEIGVTQPGHISSFTFCLSCGKPVSEFLYERGLIKEFSKQKVK